LIGNQGLDLGELIQVYTAMSLTDFIFVTGDYRFLENLTNTPNIDHILSHLAGKVVTFDQVLLCIVQEIGCSKVRERVGIAQQFDHAISQTFSMSELWEIEMAIANRIGNKRAITGNLLVRSL